MDFVTAKICSFEELKIALNLLDDWKDLQFVNLAQPNISRNVLLVRIMEKLETDYDLTLGCEDENSIPCKITFEYTLDMKKLFNFLTKYLRKRNLMAIYGACKVKSQPTISLSLDTSLDSAKVLLFSKYDKISKLICQSIKKFSNSYEKEVVSPDVELISVAQPEREGRLPTNQGDGPSYTGNDQRESSPPGFEVPGVGYPKSRTQNDMKNSYIYSKLADIRLADMSAVNFFAVVIDGEVSNNDMDECQSILKIGDDSDYDQSVPFFLDYKSGNSSEMVRIKKGDVIRVHRAAVNFASSRTYLKCWSGRSLMRLCPNQKFESTAKNPTLPTSKDWSRVDALTNWYKTQNCDEFRVPMPLSRRKLFTMNQVLESPPSPIKEIIPVRGSPVKLSEIHLLGMYTVKATVQKIDEMRKLIVISDGTICPLIQSDPPRLGCESMDSIRVICSADVFRNEKLVVGAHVQVTFNASKRNRVTMFHLVGSCEVIEVEVKESPVAAVDPCVGLPPDNQTRVGQSLNLSGIFEVAKTQEPRNSEYLESDKCDHINQRDKHTNYVTSEVIANKNDIILSNTEEMNIQNNGGDRILCPNSPQKSGNDPYDNAIVPTPRRSNMVEIENYGGDRILCPNSPQKSGDDPYDNAIVPTPQPRRSLRIAVPRIDMTALKRSKKKQHTVAIDRELKEGNKTHRHVIASPSHGVQKEEESIQREVRSPQSHVSESLFSCGTSAEQRNFRTSVELANFDSHPAPAFDYQSHDNVNFDYESHDIARKLRGKKRSISIPRSLHKKRTSTPTRRKPINNACPALTSMRFSVNLPDAEEEVEVQDVRFNVNLPDVEEEVEVQDARFNANLPDVEEEVEVQDVSASLAKPLVETMTCNRLWDSSSTSDSEDEEMELLQVKLKKIACCLRKKNKKKKRVDCIKEAMVILERNDNTLKPKLVRALRQLIEGESGITQGSSDTSFMTAIASP